MRQFFPLTEVKYGFRGTDFRETHNFPSSSLEVLLYRITPELVEKCGKDG
jgi:hypothetical protein